jgi:hypothetical protein
VARKPVQRRVVDYTSTVARSLQASAQRTRCGDAPACH